MKRKLFGIAVAILAVGLPASGQAQSQTGLSGKIATMEKQLQELKRELEKTQKQVGKNKQATKLPQDNATIKWHLAGYTDVTYTAADDYRIGTAAAPDDTFGAAKFNPIVHFKYKDIAQFESELGFKVKSDGTAETELEYANINLFLHDNLTLVAGQFLSPVGVFKERLHASWINKFPNAPAGYGHGEVQPDSDIGFQVRGGVPLGDMTFGYALAVGNGPKMSHHGPELKAFASDDNGNKMVSGRFGIIPLPHWELGASFMTGLVNGKPGARGYNTSARYRLFGGDLSYTKGPWDLRTEYLTSKLGSHWGQAEDDENASELAATRWTAWYLQGAYRLSGLTKDSILKNFEPAIRYGRYQGSGQSGFLVVPT